MRGSPRRGSEPAEVSAKDFAWPQALIATLRHSTLAIGESLPATSLNELQNLGTRDRLSLLGQFAAHIAFLQFAGATDHEFDIGEWAVVRKRGADCRLVRIGARTADVSPSPLLLAQQFAKAIDAPELNALNQTWTRAESIYAEVRKRLLADAAADLQWLQRAALGEVLAPGPGALAAMWRESGPHFVDDASAFRAHAQLDPTAELLVIGSDFPIQRYAAFAAIDKTLPGSQLAPAAVADKVLIRSKRPLFVVCGELDEDSRRVVEILRGGRKPSVDAQSQRRLILSTRVAAQRALEDQPMTRSEAEAFVTSDRYDAYLEYGTLPVDDSGFAATPEPRRSYIAALALLGTRISRTLAHDFLRQFLFEQPLEDLVIKGITFVDAEAFAFRSDAMRAYCARHIPEASRAALCRAAVDVAESATWTAPKEIIDGLGALPPAMLSARLAAKLARALAESGRYADARALVSHLDQHDRELLLAFCERRSGEYDAALHRLERLNSPSFESQILKIEILRVLGRNAEANAIEVEPANEEQKIHLAYERGLLDSSISIEPSHYFGKRLATYRSLDECDFDRASMLAAESVAAARTACERIDADLDRVFASFSAGRWDETRTIALEALAVVDEAQGDRAAAGVLFTLTFVEIDDARWSFAAQHIERLRHYYSALHDDRRLREIDLLSAYFEFCRAQFAEARRLASPMIESDQLPQIREAAALIVDEIDRIERHRRPLTARGNSHNRELEDRYRLNQMRHGAAEQPFANSFMTALAQWERSPRSAPPATATRSEKLKLFRASLGVQRDDLARAIAEELSIAMPSTDVVRAAADTEILRIAASAEYPFRPETFAVAWCYATRNRLGHWSQEGSRSVDPVELENVAHGSDWIRCSERELLFIEDSHTWSEASRAAIAALFRTRAENYRLRRIVEQEEPLPAKRDRVDGIIGESQPMRSVFALIEKIAPRDVPVCVLGESGTGKELVGRAIHRSSPRRGKTFTAINCAALPENLIESELFGHVRGAFTGADRDRAGVIETTDGGTLFLDEIGEMPLTAQAKLLRFLQDGEFRRVGDTANRSADVRIVSATNRKLETAVEEGRFREDLYYRIRGIDITLPALRERGADVMLLAQHFLARERTRHRAGPQTFTPEVEMLLQSYSWPGNVRELENTIRAGHAMAGESREIDIEHLPERLRNVKPVRTAAGSYQDAVARFRRDLIEKSLAAVAGNQNQAAALLKISRQALAYQIRELGIVVGKTPPRPRV